MDQQEGSLAKALKQGQQLRGARDIKSYSQKDQYFERVKSVYQGKSNKQRYSQNSQYPNASLSYNIEHNSLGNSPQKTKQIYSAQTESVQLINKSAQHPSSLANSKLRTEQQQSPRKKFFLNKVQKERKFKNSWENDRMIKRLHQIRHRQNKYLKQSQDLIQAEKQFKIMHQSSVLANRKLFKMQIEQKNNKFIDQLVERVKHKQTIKAALNEKTPKCIKLDESRANVAHSNRKPILLPPMVFE